MMRRLSLALALGVALRLITLVLFLFRTQRVRMGEVGLLQRRSRLLLLRHLRPRRLHR